MHCGPNWGYEVAKEERRFAHALIERVGVSIVHGHSSHYPKPIESLQLPVRPLWLRQLPE
ncbi:CapA family protein [Rhodoblastus sp. 17X3]|uniref:CapA family protein n=1 Tax=Rhodoblastus sp. 17X3 TaxID=3047026 RepID=UPI0024B841E5|nr:CapA family protein [Rhodoblastus sp. 17X3]MDI9848565.1 CapA family protein [Rhodoblastus sp. 17X3]